MAKIAVNEEGRPYVSVLDTGAMDVTIKEAFLGVGFETEEGAKLSVCMRDDGFKVRLVDASGVDHGWVDFK